MKAVMETSIETFSRGKRITNAKRLSNEAKSLPGGVEKLIVVTSLTQCTNTS